MAYRIGFNECDHFNVTYSIQIETLRHKIKTYLPTLIVGNEIYTFQLITINKLCVYVTESLNYGYPARTFGWNNSKHNRISLPTI